MDAFRADLEPDAPEGPWATGTGERQELSRWIGDTAPGSAMQGGPGPAAGNDPLEHLHREYLAALADPQHATAHDWLPMAGATGATLEDAFESMREAAASTEGDPGLYGLIEQQQPIDVLLDAWGAGTDETDLLDLEAKAASVLHLLAPEGLREQAQPLEDAVLLQQLVGTPIPALTRKEHHDIALDSSADGLHFSPPRSSAQPR